MITIVPFAYASDQTPEAEITVDVRRILPTADERFTGMSPWAKQVREHVMSQPGAVQVVSNTGNMALNMSKIQGDVRVAIGSVEGITAVALAAVIQTFLEIMGHETTLDRKTWGRRPYRGPKIIELTVEESRSLASWLKNGTGALVLSSVVFEAVENGRVWIREPRS